MTEEWYWDLHRERAVRAEHRGPADHVLGPYPSKAEAENWRERVERRNEAWDDQDAAWDAWGDDEDRRAPERRDEEE